ncbi:MAG TPA: hypothetical protein VIG45_03125, partial [Erysipelothrix sp.]
DFLKEAGAEASEETVKGDLSRVNFIEKEAWSDRELGKFAKELGEFYIEQGQIESSLKEKFETAIDERFLR